MNNWQRMASLVTLAVMALAPMALGQANINEKLETATLYVDVTNGSDSNPGTQELPLKTIARSAALAEKNNQNGIGTQVNIEPGLYREDIDLRGFKNDTNLPETYQAVTPGTVFISGADPYTNWGVSSQNPSIYSNAWKYNFGLCPPLPGAPPEPDITLRREMTFVNDAQMTQVLSLAQMVEGTFFVDEAQGQIYLWPPAGVDPNSADVEVADRYPLWTITTKNGVVLRGMTFEYSADCVSQGAVEVNYGASSNLLFDTDSFLWNNSTGLHILTTNPQDPQSNYTVQNVVANHNGQRGMATYETLNGLWQNIDASFNDWRGEQGAFTAWAAAGIYPFGDHAATYNNVTLDYNLGDGTHYDTSFENLNATGVSARNNMINGIMAEKSDGPINLSNFVVCNNAMPGFEAYLKYYAQGGFDLRDSANVTLTNSIFYGNGATGITVQGVLGGLPYVDWQTGQSQLMQNKNFVNTNNVFMGTNALQDEFNDSYLNGADWTLFQSTLTSNNNTWWNSATNMTFVAPSPNPDTVTNFSDWQQISLQDQNSSWQEPQGFPPASCTRNPDMPDFWFVTNAPALSVDASGQATYIYTSVPLDYSQPAKLTMDGISEVPGLSATLSETTMNMGDVVTFQVKAATSTVPGTYQITLIANSGGMTRTSTTFLTVGQTSIRLSTTTLNFGSIQVGKKSAPQTITMLNMGLSPVAISSINESAGYTQTNTCGTSLAAGMQCVITTTFEPTAGIPYNGNLQITDSDPASPQMVTLTGTGIAAAKSHLSAYTVGFGTQIYETTSAPKIITLTNTGTVVYSISSVTFSGLDTGDFAQTNTCGTEVPVGASCTFSITFTPMALKLRTATLLIADNTLKGSTSASLVGTGVMERVQNIPEATNFLSVKTSQHSTSKVVIQNPPRGTPLTSIYSNPMAGADAQSSKATPTGSLPPTAVGLTSGDLKNWPLVPDAVCGKPVLLDYWAFLEPSRGTYNWTTPDAQLALCSAHDTPIIFTFGGVPKWAAASGAVCNTNYCAGPPANQADLNTFATAVATRYKGKIVVYELWNEPDSPGQFKPNSAAALVTMTKALYAAVHAADPAAQFATPGFAANTTEKAQISDINAYFKAGGGFETYLAFHWYPRTSDCGTTSILSCAVTALPADIAAVKAVAGKRPVLLTESSWGPDSTITVAQQAPFATAWVQAIQKGGIVGIWWMWQKAGVTGAGYGTVWNGTALNAAGHAFETATVKQ